MKGTEKIIAHIEADAQAQADAVIAAAGQKCAEIRAMYEEQASKIYSDRIRDGVKACQDQLDSRTRIEQMEAKKGLLAVKQEMVAESFKLAQERILNLPGKQYVNFLAGLIASAAVTGEDGRRITGRRIP